ncbi:glycerate kinase [Bacillus andreraoultii]|uniref:glycerate kinase n=1 Tax=Bacillus andreraoultii TaxID=1499685 RepID=UPI000AC2C84B|nr:glycerate kinase [Bacillus andreraoultii]
MGPLDEPIQTYYAIDDSAVLECANIAGLTHVPLRLKNITTYGLGEVMKRPLVR